MGTSPQFRHEDVSAIPRGFKVRTVTHPTGHQVRIAYSPGSRRTGSGQVVSILHPQTETNPCGFDAAKAVGSRRPAVGRNPRGGKEKTREQAAAMQQKAVRFLRDVVGDSDKADEIAAMSSADYAEKKRIKLTNPGHELVRDSKGREWWIQTAKAKDGFSAQGYPVTGHGRIVGKKGSAPFKLVRKPIVAQGASEAAASDALIEKIEGRKNPEKQGKASLVSQGGGFFGFGRPKEYWQYDVEGKTYQVRKTGKSKRHKLPINVTVDTATGTVYNPSGEKVADAKLMTAPATRYTVRVKIGQSWRTKSQTDDLAVAQQSAAQWRPTNEVKVIDREEKKRAANPIPFKAGDLVVGRVSKQKYRVKKVMPVGGLHTGALLEVEPIAPKYPSQFPKPYHVSTDEVVLANPARRKNLDEIQEAQKLYEAFQGKPSTGIVKVNEPDTARDDFAMLGWSLEAAFAPRPLNDGVAVTADKLEKMDRLLSEKDPNDVKWKDIAAAGGLSLVVVSFRKDKVRLASNAEGTQLYFIGGAQDLSDCIKLFQADESKDLIELGDCIGLMYLARKAQDNFEPRDYIHILGGEGGFSPFGFYNKLQKRIYLVGGDYTIESPGIIN